MLGSYLKLNQLVKQLQEIQEKHGDLDVALDDKFKEKWCLLRDFEVRLEDTITVYDEDGDIAIKDKPVVVIGLG